MAKSCSVCRKPGATERKHLGALGLKWIELMEWTWLCDACASRIETDTNRRVAVSVAEGSEQG